MDLGVAGRLTKASIASPLTPLLLIASVLVGSLALAVLPREEEPQISVPMVDILVPADGLKAEDALELVTKPLEDIVKSIDGVEHVYSQSLDDRVVVTARFFVGTSADAATRPTSDTRSWSRSSSVTSRSSCAGSISCLQTRTGGGRRWSSRSNRTRPPPREP